MRLNPDTVADLATLADKLGTDLDGLARLIRHAYTDSLPDWPGATEDGMCPGRLSGGAPCPAGSGEIVSTDYTERWWSAHDLDSDRAPSFDGSFDWADQGEGDRMECTGGCGTAWKLPTGTEYV